MPPVSRGGCEVSATQAELNTMRMQNQQLAVQLGAVSTENSQLSRDLEESLSLLDTAVILAEALTVMTVESRCMARRQPALQQL